MKLYMFRTVPLSIIRSLALYTHSNDVCHTVLLTACQQDQGVPSWSCLQAVSKPVWHIPLLCIQWKTPDDGQRNCPKHVEFHSKYTFEKSVHVVGFVIRNLSRCTVRWTSNANEIITHAFLFPEIQYIYDMPSSVSTASTAAAVSGYGLALQTIRSQIVINYYKLHQPSFDRQTN